MDLLWFFSTLRTPLLDTIAMLVTFFGTEVVAIAVISYFYWCKDKMIGRHLGFIVLYSHIVLQCTKIVVRVERPWVLNPEFKPVEAAVAGATGYSFPSAHSVTAASFFFGLAVYIRKRWMTIVSCILVVAVMCSRMYLGVHTVWDVSVAFILAIIVVLVDHRMVREKRDEDSKSRVLAYLLLMLVLIDGLITFSLIYSGTVAVAQAMDNVKAMGSAFAFGISILLEQSFFTFEIGSLSKRDKLKRYVIGIVITGILQVGFKIVFPVMIPFAFLRYFLVVFWIFSVYPLIFSKYHK